METPRHEPKIIVRGLSKHFSVKTKRFTAIDNIDLEIRAGEFFCIVGPSGCGKTTMLRILAGLEQPDSGSFDIVRAATDARVKTHSGQPENSMVFQEQSIFPWMSVRDNVAFGLKARGIGKRERYRTAEAFIAKVGLAAFADALPHQLSGGMKQRVSIARAFANNPEILLMDEPFAALDEQTKLLLQVELLRLWEETQKSVLYVTHSIDEAIVLADRIMVMTARPGRIKDIIDVTAIFGRPRHVESVKSSTHYGELFGRVWQQLRDEVTDVASASKRPNSRTAAGAEL